MLYAVVTILHTYYYVSFYPYNILIEQPPCVTQQLNYSYVRTYICVTHDSSCFIQFPPSSTANT